MSSIISNWSPVLGTSSLTIWSEALDSVKMTTRCQSNCKTPAIWQPEGILLLCRVAGETERFRGAPGPDLGDPELARSGEGPQPHVSEMLVFGGLAAHQ